MDLKWLKDNFRFIKTGIIQIRKTKKEYKNYDIIFI